MTNIKTLIAVTTSNKWHLHQLDINNAFLYSDLREEVYMTLPHGLHTENSNLVCKLTKSLYGLK